MLIDGTLFSDCYASKKGGGFHQEDGYVSVVNSSFYNNTAGTGNEKAGEKGAAREEGFHPSTLPCRVRDPPRRIWCEM